MTDTQKAEERAAQTPASDDKRIYRCAECGVMRSKNEGGTVFTVCDDCWDRAYKKNKAPDDVREALDDLLTEVAGLMDVEGKFYCGVPKEYIDKVLAIIQPLIDQSRKDGFTRAVNLLDESYEAGIDKMIDARFQDRLDQARKEGAEAEAKRIQAAMAEREPDAHQ